FDAPGEREAPSGGAGGAGAEGGAGGEGGEGGAIGADVVAGIEVYARTRCERLFACQPMASLSRQWGDDIEDCTGRGVRFALRAPCAPGAVPQAAWYTGCAEAVDALSCKDWIDSFMGTDGRLLGSCYAPPAGARADGEPCSYNEQCQSSYCRTITAGTCGV